MIKFKREPYGRDMPRYKLTGDNDDIAKPPLAERLAKLGEFIEIMSDRGLNVETLDGDILVIYSGGVAVKLDADIIYNLTPEVVDILVNHHRKDLEVEQARRIFGGTEVSFSDGFIRLSDYYYNDGSISIDIEDWEAVKGSVDKYLAENKK